MVRLTLMYYIDFVAFMENPDKTWDDILAKQAQKSPPEPTLFEESPEPGFKGLRTDILCPSKFYRTAIITNR